MNLKNYLFCTIITCGLFLKSAELEQESKQAKEQTNYSKLLKIFPDVKSALEANNITEKIINDYPSMLDMGKTIIFFSTDTIILTVEKIGREYKIKTRAKKDILLQDD